MSLVTIEIGNSYSTVKGLDTKAFSALKKVLSYKTDPQAQFFAGGNFPRFKYMIDARGTFPTGLLMRVMKFLHNSNIAYKCLPPPPKARLKVNHRPNFANIVPYEWQMDAIRDLGSKYHRGTIAATTGSGKSLVIALIVAQLSLKTLIVVPNLELKKQLTESLTERFKDMSNIRVENIDSTALQTTTDYDVLIVDEAHHAAAKTYQKLNKKAWAGIFYRFFLTATPFRNDPEETLLFEGIAGQIIYQLTYKQAVAKGYVVPIEAYYIEIPKKKTEAYTWREVYNELIVNHHEKNLAIADIITNLKQAGANVLTLVKEIAHGEKLQTLSSTHFANGQDDASRYLIEEFNKCRIKGLIGTTGIIGEGVDTRPCEYVIIAGLGKAKSSFMQQVGRAVRTYPGKESGKVILIKDTSHKFLQRHFREQCAILKDEYNIIPTKLEV